MDKSDNSDINIAIQKLRDAVVNPGPKPVHHYATMVRHRREWPVLWEAIDMLLLSSDNL